MNAQVTVVSEPNPIWGTLSQTEASREIRTPKGKSSSLSYSSTARFDTTGDPLSLRSIERNTYVSYSERVATLVLTF